MATESMPAPCRPQRAHPVYSLGWLWFVGWLFTMGYVQLSFWKSVLGLVIWPYYLGTFTSRL
jgi:hypothetical protein